MAETTITLTLTETQTDRVRAALDLNTIPELRQFLLHYLRAQVLEVEVVAAREAATDAVLAGPPWENP